MLFSEPLTIEECMNIDWDMDFFLQQQTQDSEAST